METIVAFGVTRTRGFSIKNLNKIIYPNVVCANRSVPRDKGTSPPVPPKNNEKLEVLLLIKI